MSKNVKSAYRGVFSVTVCVLLCALVMVGLVPLTATSASAQMYPSLPGENTSSSQGTVDASVSQGSAYAIETSAGANTYVLFKSGATGSGKRYSSYGNNYNYDAASLTNGGYDIYTSANSGPIARLGLAFTVSGELSEPAVLTVLAYDIDEEQGERDYIYLVDETLGTETKLDGYLGGMNEEWNTTVMYVDQSYFTEGHTYHLKLENAVRGWVSYVRTVSLALSVAGEPEASEPVGPIITDHSFSASISASGEVSTSLYLSASEDVTYSLEYAASVDGDQRGSALSESVTVGSGGATKQVNFSLESGSPYGIYQIDVIVSDADGAPVATYRATVGYEYMAVSYDANGGSNNIPRDASGYSEGDTVTVKFDVLPSRTGYVFLGWSRNKTATEAEFTQGGYENFVIGSSDVTLYAVWGTVSTALCPHSSVTYASLDSGYHSAVCADCGYRSVEEHIYSSGITCDLCGYTDGDYIARGMCGEDLYWKLDHFGALSITGVGEMTAFSGASQVPWYSYRSLIKSVTVEGGAVSVESYAFRGCSALESVSLPETVVTIGAHAFYNCTALGDIELPDGIKSIGAYAFRGCTGFESFTLPEGIESIGGYAFYNCSSLKEMRIPASTMSIGSHAFRGCSALTNVIFDQTSGWMPGEDILLTPSKLAKPANAARYLTESYYSYTWSLTSMLASGTCGEDISWTLDKAGTLTLIGSGEMTSYPKASAVPWYAYRESIRSLRFSGEVTSIGSCAFRGCSALESVVLPESVTVIGDYAFYLCTSLSDMTMLGGITDIGAYAFRGCGALESIVLPETTETLGEYAFYKSGLTSISIPESVTVIGAYAFRGCSALTSVSLDKVSGWFVNGKVLPETKLADASTAAVYITKDYYSTEWIHSSIVASGMCGDELSWSLDGDGVLTVTGSGDMYSYDKGAAVPWYEHRASVKSVVFTGRVTSIGGNAFLSCKALESITVPDSVVSIGTNSFKNCIALRDIVLPESLITIGDSAFQGCTALASITLCGDLESIGTHAFYNCSSLTSIALPENMIFIGERAFRGCSALTEAVLMDASGWRVDGKTLHESELADASAVAGYLTSGYNDCVWSRVRVIASGMCGDALKWTLDAEGKLTISGSGAMYDYASASKVPWYAHRDKVVTVIFGGEITHIGANAFRGCTALKSAELPESVNTIGNYAFYNSAALTDISLENVRSIGSYAFRGCTGLTYISLSESVRYIGSYAFYSSGLTAATFDNVSGWQVGGGTVPEEYLTDSSSAASLLTDECCKLEWSFTLVVASGMCGDDLTWTLDEYGTLTIFGSGEMTAFTSGSSVPWYTYRTSVKTVVFEGIVTSIEKYAFRGCTALESIEIPESVEYIAAYAFYGCTSLTEIYVPDSVASIGDRAFSGCKALAALTLPEGVISIGDYAFYGCAALESAVIPESVMTIGRDAFYNCGLTSLTFKDVTTWFRTTSSASMQSMSGGTRTDVTDATVNAGYFTSAYGNYYWYKLYSVTFMTQNGVYKELTGSFGQALTKPEEPSREGYDFVGWDGTVPENFPAEDVIFTAVWQAKTIGISYVAAGESTLTQAGQALKGVFTADGVRTSVTYGVTEMLDTASSKTYGEYYNFLGWCLSEEYAADKMLTDESGRLIANIAGYTDANGRFISTETITVYGQWEQVYDGVYIENAEEIKHLGETGNYHIICDIDMGGAEWTPMDKFSGELDGHSHAVYNYSITKLSGSGTDRIGFIKDNYGTVKNLIIGKIDAKEYDEKYSVKYNISYKEDGSESSLVVGGLVTNNYGTMTGCKLINTYINVTFKDNDNNKGMFLYVAGIATLNAGIVSECSVEACNIDANATSPKSSGDDNVGWLGGICAVSSGTVSKCNVTTTILDLNVEGKGYFNYYFFYWETNKAYPKGILGGIIAEQTNGNTIACTTNANTLNLSVSKNDYSVPESYKGDIVGLISGGTVTDGATSDFGLAHTAFQTGEAEMVARPL